MRGYSLWLANTPAKLKKPHWSEWAWKPSSNVKLLDGWRH